MSSFEVSIALAKLDYIEKYKKAKVSDLNMIKDKLNAQISFFDDGKKANVTYNGKTTTVQITHFE